jgi:UDP:flavonoid glycosyltransferase YjiC (YdhE family)
VDHVGVKVMVTVVPMAGHVGPVSGLVAELVGRGHQVRVYTGARYLQRFADLGAEVLPWVAAQDFDEDDLGATFPLARRPGLPTVIAMVKHGFIGTSPGQVQDLSQALDRDPADVLVADSMSFGGVLTAELRGLPWSLLNVLPFNQGREGAPPGFRVKPARGRLGHGRDRLLWLAFGAASSPFKRAYNRARAEVGLPPDRRPYGTGLMSEWLVLATGCPSLDEPRPDLPDTVHFVGRLAPAGLALPTAADPGTSRPPLVVVTQGTHDVGPADLIQPALEGLADLDVEVLATSGRRGRTDVGITPPRNARVVDLVDFAAVLPHTAVLVSNGGWGGVLAGLAAGVPLVVSAGAAADKPEIAARVAAAGVGVNLGKGRPKPSAVASAVREVLANRGYAERARRIGSELNGLGGAGAAADLVERLAETRAPVRRSGNPWAGVATRA